MEKLKEIISEYVGVDTKDIDENMSLVGDVGLDSFGLISLLCSIEDAFDVRIPDYALSSFQTISDLSSYLASHSKNFNVVQA